MAVGDLSAGDWAAPDDGREVPRRKHQCRHGTGQGDEGLDRRRSVGVIVVCGRRLATLQHRSFPRSRCSRATPRRQKHLTDTDKNSSGDEIANVNFFNDDIAHT